jgi:hypothetical protein
MVSRDADEFGASRGEKGEAMTDDGRAASDGGGDPTEIGEFRIARGGPYYDLQRQLGLLHEHALRAPLRALILVGLAWGVPLVLSVLTGHAWGPAESHPFLLGLGVWARFFVAIGVFVFMERLVEESLRVHLRQFARAPLLAPAAMPAAAAAVAKGLRRLDGTIAELVCLVAAVLITVAGALTLEVGASSWLMTVEPAGSRLTVAGWWCFLVSNPLFWFLLLRWLWRHLVWGLLLRDLARLDLRLVATHPDGNGGLAFIGQYPNAFTAFVFAMSCVVGAALAEELLRGDMLPEIYGSVMMAWLAIVMLLFAAPLMAFNKPLSKLKEATLLTSSAAATRHQRAKERGVFGHNIAAAADADEVAAADIPDPSGTYATARKLSTNLFSRAALVPVGAAALLPLVAAGATQLPFKEVLSIAKKLILL